MIRMIFLIIHSLRIIKITKITRIIVQTIKIIQITKITRIIVQTKKGGSLEGGTAPFCTSQKCSNLVFNVLPFRALILRSHSQLLLNSAA